MLPTVVLSSSGCLAQLGTKLRSPVMFLRSHQLSESQLLESCCQRCTCLPIDPVCGQMIFSHVAQCSTTESPSMGDTISLTKSVPQEASELPLLPISFSPKVVAQCGLFLFSVLRKECPLNFLLPLLPFSSLRKVYKVVLEDFVSKRATIASIPFDRGKQCHVLTGCRIRSRSR